MKKIVVVSVGLCFLFLAFSDYSNSEKNEAKAKEMFSQKVSAFVAEVKAFSDQDFQEIEQTDLIANYKQVQAAYKRCEFLLAYYYPEHVKAYINGAPLQHLDPYPLTDLENQSKYYADGPVAYLNSRPLDFLEEQQYKGEPVVVEPKGLQVLDELIFEEEPDRKEIQKIAEELLLKSAILASAAEKMNFVSAQVICDASRQELIRVAAFHVSGFDTPASLLGIEFASEAIQGMEPFLTNALQSHTDFSALQKLLKDNQAFLKNADFNEFDRAAYLRDYLNPLYAMIGRMQSDLHIPSAEDLSGLKTAWNAKSQNLFSDEIINPYYYAFINEKDDSKDLRDFGKRLFYDARLSKNRKLSCASCHEPKFCFTDKKPKSDAGVEGKQVQRNSPTLMNAVYADRYFYDLRAADLEDQIMHVIKNTLEFNTTFSEIENVLSSDQEFVETYQQIFGTQQIGITKLTKAISSYLISLRSYNSEFDRYMRKETDQIDARIIRGFNLFMGKAACATCHFVPTFSGLVPPYFEENESEVLGVLSKPEAYQLDSDQGRFNSGIKLDQFEIYRNSFKTVSVRNVKLTAPYFHNGAFETLDQVLDFYNNGGAQGIGMSYEVSNQTLAPDSLGLTNKEKQDIIQFLNALSDCTFK